jgi:hypothetical protein
MTPETMTGSLPKTALRPAPVKSCTLRELAFIAMAALNPANGSREARPEIRFFHHYASRLSNSRGAWGTELLATLNAPCASDARLIALAADLVLTPIEILAVALAAAVEDDPTAGRAIAYLQAPLGGSRPTLGLLAKAFASTVEVGESALAILFQGAAARCGLLEISNETAPIAERFAAVPAPLCLALDGHASDWPGVTISGEEAISLPDSIFAEARRQAGVLSRTPHGALLVRSGSPAEGRAVAGVIARALGLRPALIETERMSGLGPWLRLCGLLPVFDCDLGPSDRKLLPALAGYDGPVIALAGPDGAIETKEGAPPAWILPVPAADERETLWRRALGDSTRPLAARLAREHRHGAGRIAQLGRLARHHAALGQRTVPEGEDLLAAAWNGEGRLSALAELWRISVPEAALVVAPALRRELDLLLLRCRHRDGLGEGLGAAATVRYRPGVRALFTGPSGTGKTLAAAWLATRLGLPLYRVDLASVTSKYIGETEKNLAQLLARAEQAEVVLLFDEADSLFGKRTDVRDSNDRFANTQTNYLLQRVESYDGLIVLTSNSQSRIDDAFARRLDLIIEFPLPSPDERRALWLAHLGAHHAVEPSELNRMASLTGLAGGHVRNAVLTAALLAREDGRAIKFEDCVRGIEIEYRKVGRQVPGGLGQPGAVERAENHLNGTG